MQCQDLDARLADYLRNELDAGSRRAVDAHLQGCASCRADFAAAAGLWEELDAPLPGPSPALSKSFYAMLSDEVARRELRSLARGEGRQGAASSPGFFRRLWPTRPAWALSYSLVLLLSGVVLGEGLQPARSLLEQGAGGSEPVALSQERLIQLCSVQDLG